MWTTKERGIISDTRKLHEGLQESQVEYVGDVL